MPFLLYSSVSTHLVHFLNDALDTFLSERWTDFLTGAKIIKSSYSFDFSVAHTTNPINIEALSFFLSTCCSETVCFKIKSHALEVVYNNLSKAEGLVLSRYISARLHMNIRNDQNLRYIYKDLNAPKVLLVKVDTLSWDTVDSHQYQQLVCRDWWISD